MKRKPKLTKRERKELTGRGPAPDAAPAGGGDHQHIHCIACGKHLEPSDFEPPAVATIITCDHGSNFPSCVRCMLNAQSLVAEHDRTGNPVRTTAAWH